MTWSWQGTASRGKPNPSPPAVRNTTAGTARRSSTAADFLPMMADRDTACSPRREQRRRSLVPFPDSRPHHRFVRKHMFESALPCRNAALHLVSIETLEDILVQIDPHAVGVIDVHH